MLVLTRRKGERIRIGANIYVTIVEIDRNQVRLGIDAPKDTPIAREEILTNGIGQPPVARKQDRES